MDAVADSDLASSWAGGRSGFVSLDEGFGAASDAGLQEDRARDAVWSGRIARPSLAALLAEAGVASEEQLRIAVAEGMGSGERLGEVVLRRGWIDEAGLARVLARQWGLAFLDDEAVAVDPAAAALVPLEQSTRLGAFAIGFSEGLPVIALAEPTEERFEAVRTTLGGDCRFAVVTRSTLERLFERLRSSDAEARVERESAAAAHLAEEQETEILIAELDRATEGLVALRARVEQLRQSKRASERELAESQAELEALRKSRAAEQATLQNELIAGSELLGRVKAKLAEVVQLLEDD